MDGSIEANQGENPLIHVLMRSTRMGASSSGVWGSQGDITSGSPAASGLRAQIGNGRHCSQSSPSSRQGTTPEKASGLQRGHGM